MGKGDLGQNGVESLKFLELVLVCHATRPFIRVPLEKRIIDPSQWKNAKFYDPIRFPNRFYLQKLEASVIQEGKDKDHKTDAFAEEQKKHKRQSTYKTSA
ncbi:hypothetical protein CHS0354_034789 [Potamilus streckersoni]|uniref:Uncharacterized protein n=1 Tax=Potamilus streckersoni TaxID=2493646 RepID=A0AAE0RSX9_9BIVA|nr:hypothetical protein CHS0354_034789 [Potamilus streckersoni]